MLSGAIWDTLTETVHGHIRVSYHTANSTNECRPEMKKRNEGTELITVYFFLYTAALKKMDM